MTADYDDGGLMSLDDDALFEVEAPPSISLTQEFLVPPLSILDTRQGYWQDRKRAWMSLGIRSELGRDNAAVRDTWQVIHQYYYRDKTAHELATGVPMTNAEWEVHAYGRAGGPPAKSLTYATGGGDDPFSQKLQAMTGGTSVFDPVLCELIYRWFTPEGGRVLDPFAGGSVRGVTASVLGRAYTGLELRGEQVEANRAQAEIGSSVVPVWIHTDARSMGDHLDPVADEYDLVFTCPPYADLEVYSDDPQDLSTMPYDDFLTAYRDILDQAATYLRRDRFYVIVVGEVRDRKGLYRNFVGDTVDAVRDAGLALYNTGVLVNAVGTAAMRTPRQFRATRKFGLVHQHVLVFVKGDPKAASDACGVISVRNT